MTTRISLYLLSLTATAMLSAVAMQAQQGPAGGDGAGDPEALHKAAPAASVAPAAPAAVNPGDIVQLVVGSPWCGSDDGRAVVVPPPTGVPPAELNRAIYNLIHSEPSWSLTDIKRAVRLMGATNDPSATTFLNQLVSEAATIVRTRSAALGAKVRRNEAAQYQAYLQKATLDLQKVIREQLPRS